MPDCGGGAGDGRDGDGGGGADGGSGCRPAAAAAAVADGCQTAAVDGVDWRFCYCLPESASTVFGNR